MCTIQIGSILSLSLPLFDWFNDNKAFFWSNFFLLIWPKKKRSHFRQMFATWIKRECVWDELISYANKDFVFFVALKLKLNDFFWFTHAAHFVRSNWMLNFDWLYVLAPYKTRKRKKKCVHVARVYIAGLWVTFWLCKMEWKNKSYWIYRISANTEYWCVTMELKTWQKCPA